MDFDTMMSVVQTLFSALQCSELKEMWSRMGYKSELEELSCTVESVWAVLLDAEVKQEQLSHEARVWIEELKDAVYEADDLLDEFVSVAKHKQPVEGYTFSEKVRLLFSRFIPIGVSCNMPDGVEKIRKKLDGIVGDHSKFGLGLDHKPIRRRRGQTCSYVDTDIIGREEDIEKIVSMLLDSNNDHKNISFLSIVGSGGIGKTALARLVYDDERVAKEFSLRMWVSVSDQDQKQLDAKSILSKILDSAIGLKLDDIYHLLKFFREHVACKQFFLVLDGLWIENLDELQNLIGFLMGCQSESRIVVTTRSVQTASAISGSLMYKLQALTEHNSQHLFERVAFGSKQRSSLDDFVEAGQQISRSCAGVPLAIRVVGSLLCGQDKTKWMWFQKIGLAKIKESKDGLMSILKLSYQSLESPLKSCFSYCAIFPRGSDIDKKTLIRLWMAQGYIVPLYEGQSTEEAAEKYFLILLSRGFFQEVKRDDFGEIKSCRMHDVVHDLAQEVAGQEVFLMDSFDGCVDKKARHVCLLNSLCDRCLSTRTSIRTYLHGETYSEVERMDQDNVNALLSKLMSLRALALTRAGIERLPNSIGKLLHLRFLDLSRNEMEVLPKSITNIGNLQTLMLCYCSRLKELPEDLSKLLDLRVLDTVGCCRLNRMPLGMGKLTGLETLTRFAVGEASSSFELGVQMDGLKALEKLKGALQIEIRCPESASCVKEDIVRGAYLSDKKHLNEVQIFFNHEESGGNSHQEAALLEELQPHSNVRALRLTGYCGERLSSWARGDNLVNCLPNLVRLELCDCEELRCISSLGKLQLLKVLFLVRLSNLEYIENTPASAHSALQSSSVEGSSFLPCLEELCLLDLPKLEGWWSSSGEDGNDALSSLVDSTNRSKEQHQSLLSPVSLSRLRKLSIMNCPELICFPSCPQVEKLMLNKFNKRLTCFSSTFSSDSSPLFPKLIAVQVDNVTWLQQSLPKEALQCLKYMEIQGDTEVESLADVFQGCSSSLRTLKIGECSKLRSLSGGGLEQLSKLKALALSYIPTEVLTEVREDGMQWRSLNNTLHSLDIHCPELQSLPRWIPQLTSLQRLDMGICSAGLMERCQNPIGEDWPLIQHIPYTSIRDFW